jgi:membrane carboxypeptidase/penicillin-binding protein PbpC
MRRLERPLSPALHRTNLVFGVSGTIVDVSTTLEMPVNPRREASDKACFDMNGGAGVARRLPPFLPGTPAEFAARSGNPPRIISPSHDSEILLVSATSIPLRAKADADVRGVYWFAGKTFLGKCSAAEVLSWKSAPGDYELTVLDDHGRAGSCKVIVR